MGTFEKLGILVIVVIIVMILAVAIYQWGGNAAETPLAAVDGSSGELIIKDIDDYEKAGKEAASVEEESPAADEESWPGGVPRKYTIQKNDSVWKLVFRRWRLKDSFVKEIAKANRNLKIEHLRPGAVIRIPNPAGFFRDKGGAKRNRPTNARTRVYEVQIGDTLERIARKHLGRTSRWREIQELNPGIDPKRLQAGQKILLPAIR